MDFNYAKLDIITSMAAEERLLKLQSENMNSLDFCIKLTPCVDLIWDERCHNKHPLHIWMKYDDDGGRHRAYGYELRGRLPGYLAALEPGWGCPWSGHWLFELPPFPARGPGRLCP